MGNGGRGRFWLDKWCDNETLSSLFPSQFDIAIPRDAWVEEIGVSLMGLLGTSFFQKDKW